MLGRVLAYGVFGLHAQVYSVLVPSEFAPPYPRVMGRVCSTLVPGPGVLGPPASIKVILMHKRAELIKYNLIKNSIS